MMAKLFLLFPLLLPRQCLQRFVTTRLLYVQLVYQQQWGARVAAAWCPSSMLRAHAQCHAYQLHSPCSRSAPTMVPWASLLYDAYGTRPFAPNLLLNLPACGAAAHCGGRIHIRMSCPRGAAEWLAQLPASRAGSRQLMWVLLRCWAGGGAGTQGRRAVEPAVALLLWPVAWYRDTLMSFIIYTCERTGLATRGGQTLLGCSMPAYAAWDPA